MDKIYSNNTSQRSIIKIFGAIILVIVLIFTLQAYSKPNPNRESGRGDFAFAPWDRLKNSLGIGNNDGETVTQSDGTTVRVVNEDNQVVSVVEKASPAVVSIVASAEVPRLEQCYQRSPGFQNLPPGFEGLFDVPTLCERGTELKQVGAGTGFLVSDDGYIMTNKHVVEDTNAEYTVILNDKDNQGKKVSAKVLARDPNNDIAVLKIDMKNLPYLTFGDSGKIKVGQTAIAIGYSLGEFANTVSKGVVSGLSRSIIAGGSAGGPERLRGLIQTDAAINPGNSGGPLLDIGGNVIGMNVAMANAQSIGFTIPANEVHEAFDEVKASGKISADKVPFIGVRYVPINRSIKNENNLPYDYGMLVSRGEKQSDVAVMPGSPAEKAGLTENDIILEVDGKQLNEGFTLADIVANHKPGDEIELKIFHKGTEKKIKLKLGTRE